ncbi:hypothetical protein [Bacillus cereus group sp. Bce006]|uniref:hypothetical protein n=1 Tax=Bacillus cereus group sp. Bce006 TaxID=3445255 RepID=UPI003F20D8E7|nr:hypothetical protein [Bacillus cereus]
MIKIERDNLDFLAKRHFEEYFVKKKFYKKLKDYADSEKDAIQKEFFKSIYNQIEDIVMGRPSRLNKIIKDLSEDHQELMGKMKDYSFLKKLLNEYKKQQENLEKNIKKNLANVYELKQEKEDVDKRAEKVDSQIKYIEKFLEKIKKIFNYSNFCDQYSTDKVKIWGAYELVKQLKVGACPYCNRHFITVSEPNKDDGGRTRPQLDHFYSKSRFPFLAVSFFNLIPCCYVCNSNLKRNEEFSIETHIHPYENSFEDLVQFTVKFQSGKGKKDYLKAWNSNTQMFSIDFKVNEMKKNQISHEEYKTLYRKIEKNKEIFKLKSLYNSHIDYVEEMIVKNITYSDDKIESLCQEFPDLFPSKHDVVRVVYSNYVDTAQLDKRVLSKLTRDITQEFGIKYT